MALSLFAYPQFTKMLCPQKRPLWNSNFHFLTQCKATNEVANYHSQTILRRSFKFQPSIWTNDYIQSLNNEYKEEMYANQHKRLREEVKMMLCKIENDIDKLEFIDVLQRLGVSYHFTNEIKNILNNIHNKVTMFDKNLHATSLMFRLLRQHRYDINADVFVCFQEEMCNFKKDQLVDVQGMLSMYEASFHSFEDEIILDEARDFTSIFLKEYLNQNGNNQMSLKITHALELSLHWRIDRWESRWFIYIYESQENKNHVLLQFAKLDFNIVQNIYQDDLKYTSRWWKRTALGEKLSFARDRLVESFVWTVGMNFKPNFECYQKVITKVITIMTIVDDIYDVYGTLEELELFTKAIERWDINAINHLPQYMKICFITLYNFVNEIAFEALKKSEHSIIPHIKKMWTGLCKAYLIEAKWYNNGYAPSLEEYLENAKIFIGVPTILTHAYFLIPHSFKMDDLVCMDETSNIVQLSAMIVRLADDLATYERELEMGDTPKSIQCYMNESGANEVEAREYIKSMICTLWKKINKEAHSSSFSQSFIDTCLNFARMAMLMYQHGDGHSTQDSNIKNRITSLIFQPIPIK